ncbi:MAG: hypothetical protein LBU27_07325 [Candidatus Peribacteria bacterium]|jgi:hypothetical protein|nr:hypothetical protein [Candidatus Peribacteria bacterium]
MKKLTIIILSVFVEAVYPSRIAFYSLYYTKMKKTIYGLLFGLVALLGVGSVVPALATTATDWANPGGFGENNKTGF